MAADNAAAVLVENILADDQHIDASTGTIVVNHSAYNPGIIDLSKYQTLMAAMGNPAAVPQIKKSLGLGHGKNDLLYNVEIALSTTAPYPYPGIYDTTIAPDGAPSGSNVGQSKRFVYVVKNDDQDVPIDYTMAILTMRVW